MVPLNVEFARNAAGVVDVSLVRPRWIGYAVHAEVELTVDRDITIAEAHAITEEVQHLMMHAVPKLSSVSSSMWTPVTMMVAIHMRSSQTNHASFAN